MSNKLIEHMNILSLVVQEKIKFQKFFYICSISLLLFYSATTQTYAQENNSVIISEINYAGSYQSEACKQCYRDKWIELSNMNSQPVNISGWSIQFHGDSTNSNDTIYFPSATNISPYGHYMIRYKAGVVTSIFDTINFKANGQSGKVLNVSNNTQGSKFVQARLKNTQKEIVFSVYLGNQELEILEQKGNPNTSHSVEYIQGQWQLSTQEFSQHNFGTPETSSVGSFDDLDVVKEAVGSQTSTANPTPSYAEAVQNVKIETPNQNVVAGLASEQTQTTVQSDIAKAINDQVNEVSKQPVTVPNPQSIKPFIQKNEEKSGNVQVNDKKNEIGNISQSQLTTNTMNTLKLNSMSSQSNMFLETKQVSAVSPQVEGIQSVETSILGSSKQLPIFHIILLSIVCIYLSKKMTDYTLNYFTLLKITSINTKILRYT